MPEALIHLFSFQVLSVCSKLTTLCPQTLEKAPFYVYMKLEIEGPGAAHARTIIAVWNTVLYAGGIISCMACPIVGDRYGRKKVIGLGAITSVIGAALQAGSVNPAMMIVARLIVGVGMGILIATVPLYQAEIAPPSNRGLIVGLHGAFRKMNSWIMLTDNVSFSHWIWIDDLVLDWGRLLPCTWRCKSPTSIPKAHSLTRKGWLACSVGASSCFPSRSCHGSLLHSRKSEVALYERQNR